MKVRLSPGRRDEMVVALTEAGRADLAALLRPVVRTEGQRARAVVKDARRIDKKLKTALVHHECEVRAKGKCESCRLPSVVLQLDHFLGGYGRRTEREAVETCWMICPPCHRRKTDNEPDRRTWCASFKFFCENRGYPVPPEVEAELAWPFEGV